MMKPKTYPPVKKVRSMKELKLEKARLIQETRFTEERIKGGYQLLVLAFSTRSLVQIVMEEMVSTSSVFSQAYQLGKFFFTKKKKKKKAGKSDDMNENNQVSED
jgi:hypothetical protein